MSIRKIINSVGLGFQNLSRVRLLKKRFIIDDSFFPNNEKFIASDMETPQFLIDQSIIETRYLELRKSLFDSFPKWEIAYSFKTNYEVAKLGVIGKLGITAEVVSGYEYSMAKKLGYAGRNIIFNGPYKKDSELLVALHDGAMVNLDTWRQVDQIIALKNKLSKKIQVGIRVRGQIQGLDNSRFGYSMDDGEALSVIRKLAKHGVGVIGIHRHIGTDIYFPHMYQESAFQLGSFMGILPPIYKRKIQYVDMGGGFPGHGLPPFHLEKLVSGVRPIDDYIWGMAQGFKKSKLTMSGIRLIVEPGRYLVNDAAVWVTKIVDCKTEDGKQIVICDGANTMLPLVYYCPQVIRIFSQDLTQIKRLQMPTRIYGTTCQESDILYMGPLEKCVEGDLLLYYAVGAYNQSMSSNFVNGMVNSNLI